MQHYFLVVGDRDEGPFPDTRLRDFLREGMLTPQMAYREAKSGRQLSHDEMVQVLAPPAELPAVDGIEYPVSFQTSKQPFANPYGFTGKGNAGILCGRLGLEGMQSHAGAVPTHETVIVPFSQISSVSVAGSAVSFSVAPPATEPGGRTQPVTLFFTSQASANHFASALPQ
jgi:hypothetical protein